MRVFIFVIFFLASAVSVVSAKIGVGVGTGKIVVEDKLKPGIIYKLPPLTVVNTGDESADYEVAVTYHQDQPELMPRSEWFDFYPREFHLGEGEVQVVEINLDLPIKAAPGDYFAYLEGHPLKKSQSGTTAIGVAAAAKLYFTVVPANVLQGIYYKIISLWKIYSPWTSWIAIVVVVVIAVLFIKKYFNIQINLKQKKSSA